MLNCHSDDRSQDAYAQMLATYELVEAAYAERGLDMPDIHLQDPEGLCLVLQKMWHDLRFQKPVATKA